MGLFPERKSKMRTALVIRHVPFEDLGAFGPVLARAGFAVRYAEAGERFGDDRHEDLLIVLGGPIDAGDDAHYPFLAEEHALVERRLKRGQPTMGICLGAQIMARVLGARVFRGSAKEIGIAPLRLTAEGRRSCLAPFASDPLTLHWHGDTFDLPRGAELLASTDITENQAFSFGPNAIGFQFHPEAQPARFEQWLVGHAVEIAQAGLDPRQLRADMLTHGGGLATKAARVMNLWLDQSDLKGA